MYRFILVCNMVFVTLGALAQKKPVSFEMAFENAQPRLTQSTGYSDGWLDDKHFIWVEKGEGEGEQTVRWKVNAETGQRDAYRTEARPNADKPGYHRTQNRMAEVWLEEDDVFFQAQSMEQSRRLTKTKTQEQNPQLSPDGKKVAFTRAGNFYVTDVETGLEEQLTEDGSDTLYNGYASWVYFEEILGRSSRYRAFWWSPDSKKLCYMQFDDSPVKTFPIYHEEGNYGHLEITRYPKSGEQNPRVKMGVLHLDQAKTQWFDFDPDADEYLAWPFWTPDSTKVHVQWMNRDQNHLIIYECDAGSGQKKPVYEEKQNAWVEFFNDITYLEDGSGFLLRSDKDGWRHLYYHGMDGHLISRLTSGPWRVMNIEGIDLKGKRVYFSAKKSDMAGMDYMSVRLDGSDLQSHTAPGGTHQVEFSPKYTYFLDKYSDSKTPAQVRLHRTSGKLIRTIADSKNSEIEEYQLAEVEYFTIPSGDGYELPAWWVIPHDLDRKSGQKKYGVIFRIYSGPDAPTVRNTFARTLTDHYFAQEGVITISVDHRASGHFGKAGVEKMYRRLGHWEVHDLKQAVTWLKAQPFIDPARIGITGHSYGGYMTLLALAKANDSFTHGVSGAPVTDWALYDTVYTERYMDRPQDNPEGYREGSVLNFAKQIKGTLRLIHGTIDDNVHFQNSLQLVRILTDENIPFEFMAYPGSRHGIRQRAHRAAAENAFWFQHFLGRPFQSQSTN